MTPRERWDAAVALQHAMVEQVDALPVEDGTDQRFCDIMNAATEELEAAADECGIGGKEFSAAYRIHREAFFRRSNRVARQRAEDAARRLEVDAQEVWLRARMLADSWWDPWARATMARRFGVAPVFEIGGTREPYEP